MVILPYNTPPQEILDYEPEGLLISSGPGNPSRVKEGIRIVQKLSEELPIFGICLGQQIISLAFGAKIYKMKFGHRGANQPVKDLESGKITITSQNHGFAIDRESCEGLPLEVTQINLNDNTVEGVKHEELPIIGVQYHPEAGPGPKDTDYHFDHFLEDIKKN